MQVEVHNQGTKRVSKSWKTKWNNISQAKSAEMRNLVLLVYSGCYCIFFTLEQINVVLELKKAAPVVYVV